MVLTAMMGMIVHGVCRGAWPGRTDTDDVDDTADDGEDGRDHD